MKRLATDKAYNHQIKDNAQVYIGEKLGCAQAVEKITSRIREIYQD